MPDEDKVSISRLSGLFFSFWVVRGFLAALSITAIAANGTSLERFEFLRAVFFIVQEWWSLLSGLGDWMTRVLGWKIAALDLNIAIVFSLTVAPGMGAIIRSHLSYIAGNSRRAKALFYDAAISAAILFVSFWAVRGLFGSETLLDLKEYFGPLYNHEGGLFIVAALILLCTIAAFRMIRGYLQGIIIFATMIAALQIMYFLESPIISDIINSTVCDNLNSELSGC